MPLALLLPFSVSSSKVQDFEIAGEGHIQKHGSSLIKSQLIKTDTKLFYGVHGLKVPKQGQRCHGWRIEFEG